MGHFTESDLERMLYRDPGAVRTQFYGSIERWVARQLRVPSGVIDLLGVARDNKNWPIPVVVELKNRPLRSEDVAQVLRYSADINEILICLASGSLINQIQDAVMLLIGRGVPSDKVLFEAYAANVHLHSFEINEGVEVSGSYSWVHEFYRSKCDTCNRIAQSPIFDVFYEQGK